MHTPTPLRAYYNEILGKATLGYDGTKPAVGKITGSKELIETIVHAVNSHDALVKALEATLASLQGWMEIADEEDEREYDYKAVELAQAALTLAKKG